MQSVSEAVRHFPCLYMGSTSGIDVTGDVRAERENTEHSTTHLLGEDANSLDLCRFEPCGHCSHSSVVRSGDGAYVGVDVLYLWPKGHVARWRQPSRVR